MRSSRAFPSRPGNLPACTYPGQFPWSAASVTTPQTLQKLHKTQGVCDELTCYLENSTSVKHVRLLSPCKCRPTAAQVSSVSRRQANVSGPRVQRARDMPSIPQNLHKTGRRQQRVHLSWEKHTTSVEPIFPVLLSPNQQQGRSL